MCGKGRSGIWACLAMTAIMGCASSGGKKTAARETMRAPAGVDRMTAAKAFRNADSNFVSKQRERQAVQQLAVGRKRYNKVDEFWKYLDQSVQRGALSGAQQQAFDRELAAGAEALTKWRDATSNGQNQKMLKAAKAQCYQAQQHLENAVRLDPFNRDARVLLAMNYYALQHYFDEEKNYERAVEVLERLVRLEKGEHELYRLLGENYMAMKVFDQALINFRRAQNVVVKTSFDTPPDTSMLFFYAYMQGDAFARLHNAPGAVKSFQTAKRLARSEQEKTDVDNYLKWINWDGGNIRASEAWDEILKLEGQKSYAAVSKACMGIIPHLKTRKAKLSVHHKLAVMEFEFTGKKEKAVERMRALYEALTPEQKAQPDETVQAYLNAYGAMLFSLGVESRNKDEKKVALAYFSKSVSFDWDQMAKALRETITLVWNTPEQAITYGKKALEVGQGVLSEEEICEVFSLMVKAHKSAGKFDEARTYFTKWKACDAPQTD